MNATKAMTLLAATSLAISAQALTLAVKDVKIAQRYPWNGLVDIDYTVECDDKDADVYIYPVGYDADNNKSVALYTFTGEGANGKAVKAGTHRMTWDMAKDMGQNYNRAAFSIKLHGYAGAAPYLVIDLSSGANAEKYEVSYLNEMPEGGWTDEYKTTKLVLKLIPPGTFLMGSPNDELGHEGSGSYNNNRWGSYGYVGKETRHTVTLTQPFYCAVFEITEQQWNLIYGGGIDNTYAKGNLWYNLLRGSVLGSKWPEHQQVDADSFIGKLRSRTGVTFDLPTEAQWEYACRAGTDSALNNNMNLTTAYKYCPNLDKVGAFAWYDGSRTYTCGRQKVGSYQPNAFGLYDMHGGEAEWCLDWFQMDLGAGAVSDPKGPNSGHQGCRVLRGGRSWHDNGNGCYYETAWTCRSAARYFYSNCNSGGTYYFTPEYRYAGCRLVALPAAK